MENLQTIDESLLRFFNKTISNSVFDKIFPFITEVDAWVLVYLAGFIWLFWKGGTAGRLCAVALILTVTVTDQLNSSILKEYFGRLRPCHTLTDINVLVDCGGGKSMPSSHAANNFAAAWVIVSFFKKNQWIWFTLAAMMAFSRVYIGVHYPMDILAGAVVGTIIGLSVSQAVIWAKELILKKTKVKPRK